MPAPWIQEFDFYIGVKDGWPLFVRLDMAAKDHMPAPGYAIAATIRVPMKHPNKNGLRSTEEFAAMSEVEDRLVPAITTGVDAIYWGLQITQGRTDFLFYLHAEMAPDLSARIRQPIDVPGYSVEVSLAEDPNWTKYLDRYPNTFFRQTMWNRKLQWQLQQQGSRLSRRRMIDHASFFPSAEAANEAAGRLKKAKFSVDRVEGPDETGSFTLEFRRKDSCAGPRPDEITIEILDIIEPSGGVYDGWGCIA